MTYDIKHWQLNDSVLPEDMNRIEQGVFNNTKNINDVKNHKITAADVKTTNSNVQDELDTIKAPGWVVSAIGDGTIPESKLEDALKNKIGPHFADIGEIRGVVEHNDLLIRWGILSQVFQPGDSDHSIIFTGQFYSNSPSVQLTARNINIHVINRGVFNWNIGRDQRVNIRVRNLLDVPVTTSVEWLFTGRKAA